jgi:hypothetical protein
MQETALFAKKTTMTGLTFVLAFVSFIGSSWAQEKNPSSAVDQVKALTAEAASAIEAYSYRKAEEKLEQALSLAAESGLDQSPHTAEVYMMMGVSSISGSNDLYRGLHYFVKALRLNPKIGLPQRLTTPQLTEMLANAKKTVKELSRPPTVRLAQESKRETKTASQSPTKPSGLTHVPIDSAKRGYPILVRADAGSDIQAHRGFVFYRLPGVVQFISIPMAKTGTTFRAAIPPEATKGRYIHYYIEARDKRGRLAASFGSAKSPTVIIIKY